MSAPQRNLEVLTSPSSVLGYTTATVQVLATKTAYVTATAIFATGTNTFDSDVFTANAVTGAPLTTTVTGIEATITACVSPDKKVKRQVALSANVRSAASLPTPSLLVGGSPSQISVVCVCLAPTTPNPVTTTVTQTSVAMLTKPVNVIVTHTNKFYVTPAITPVSCIV